MEWLVADEEYVTGRGMEELPAGPSLAVMLDCVSMGDEPGIGMDQAALLESMRAGQKTESWATARKLQAIAEFESRLDAEDSDRYEFLYAELSLAMRISKNAAADLVFVADRLVRHLPDTFAAMKCGRISFPQAKIIATATADLEEDLAVAVEARVLERAHRQTTGQLRAAVKTAIKTVDPEAFKKKLDEDVKSRRVEVWDNQFGTSDLVGRNLPATVTDAALNRLGALARSLKDDGDPRTMDQLCADLFVALLLGHPTHPDTSLAPDPDYEPGPDPDRDSWPADSEAPAGHSTDPDDPGPAEPIEDEIPEADTSLWDDEGPVEDNPPSKPAPAPAPAPTQGGVPVPADLSDPTTMPAHQGSAARAKAQTEADQARQARQDATAIADLAHTQIPELIHTWLNGHPHPSHERRRLAISEAARIFTTHHRTDPGASRTCTFTVNHDGTLTHGTGGYRPPAAMRRLINNRDRTCVFPTCRQPATRTDCDHTLAYDSSGPTCPCNLALLCRGHHRAKQCDGWALHHLFPGVLLWITPTGSWHIVGPAP